MNDEQKAKLADYPIRDDCSILEVYGTGILVVDEDGGDEFNLSFDDLEQPELKGIVDFIMCGIFKM